MWTLTITHGEYHGLKTVTHTSDTAHGWEYRGDGYWQFWAGDLAGTGGWDAIVADVRSAIDIKHEEPATAQGEVEDPVSGWVQDGAQVGDPGRPLVPPFPMPAWGGHSITAPTTGQMKYQAKGEGRSDG